MSNFPSWEGIKGVCYGEMRDLNRSERDAAKGCEMWLRTGVNFEDLKDNSGLFEEGKYKEGLIKSLVSVN